MAHLLKKKVGKRIRKILFTILEVCKYKIRNLKMLTRDDDIVETYSVNF